MDPAVAMTNVTSEDNNGVTDTCARNKEVTDTRADNNGGPWVYINRPAYTQVKVDEILDLQTKTRSLRDCPRPSLSFNRKCMKETCELWFPFVKIMRAYRPSHMIGDAIAGISVGVMHVPQGLGFALLAGVPPIYGLYSSFFPNLIYFLFGTSRHACLGTMALISMLIGAVVERETANINPGVQNTTWSNRTSAFQYSVLPMNDSSVGPAGGGLELDTLTTMRVSIATSMSLLVGLFQIGMGVFKLGGVVIRYMPSPFVGGFTTAAAFHIIIGQLKSLLGVPLPIFPGTFQLPKTLIFLFANITRVNLVALLIGVLCIGALVVMKCVNSKIKTKSKVTLPAELIVVIVVTIISHFGRISDKYSLSIVGTVPRGFQVPVVPQMPNVDHYIIDALITALVSFAMSISLVQLFAEKYEYSVDVNQETFAFGMCNGVSSFFLCFAGAIAPPRCLVFESTGGKSQVANLISSIFLLLIIIAIGPLFQDLPNTVLAAIIIVAVFPLVLQFRDLKKTWLVSPCDCIIWLVTWAAVVVLDIALGVITGIIFCVVVVLIQTHMAHVQTLHTTEQPDIYASESHKNRQTSDQIKIFRSNGMLCFANAENLKSQIYDALSEIFVNYRKNNVSHEIPEISLVSIPDVRVENKINQIQSEEEAKVEIHPSVKNQLVEVKNETIVILDCGAITYVDCTGLNILRQIRKHLSHHNICFYLTNCSHQMFTRLTSHGWSKEYLENNVFPTLQDAIAHAQLQVVGC